MSSLLTIAFFYLSVKMLECLSLIILSVWHHSNILTKGSMMEEEIGTCDEEPPGILRLIDQLENIVDTLLPG